MKILTWVNAIIISWLVLYQLWNPVETADASSTWGLALMAPAMAFAWIKVRELYKK